MKSIFGVLALFAVLGLGLKAEAQGLSREKTIIAGKLTRSGGTNKQPLSDATLKSLCEQGYTQAIYVYKGGTDKTVSCGKGSIRYVQMLNWKNPDSIVNRISSEAAHGGKTLVHCYWGVHASNFVTAAALVKMCNYSGDKAVEFFKSSVPASSLSPKAISPATLEFIYSSLRDMRPSGSRTSGCP